MAVGIAIEKKLKINDKLFALDTNGYEILKDKVTITNKKNIEKISKWFLLVELKK